LILKNDFQEIIVNMPTIASIANINDYVVNFLSSSLGAAVSTGVWMESGEQMTELINVFEDEDKGNCPWVSEKMTKKAKAVDLAVKNSIESFLTVFAPVLFTDSVWDTLSVGVYKRMVNALWMDLENQTALKNAIKNTKPEKTDKKKSTRNKSAYLFCCQHFRQVVKDENPGISPQEVTKKLSEKWESCQLVEGNQNNELFEKFTQMAKDDKIRYEAENPKPVKEKKEKKEKKPKNKRGKSAWVIFCEIKRSDACEKLGSGASNQEVMAILGGWWASDDFTEVKMVAEERSLADKERVKKLKDESSSDEDSETDVSKLSEMMKTVTVSVVKEKPAVKNLNFMLSSSSDDMLEEEVDEPMFE